MHVVRLPLAMHVCGIMISKRVEIRETVTCMKNFYIQSLSYIVTN